jgi:leucyl aminopeptidase
MKITLSSSSPTQVSTDVLAVGVHGASLERDRTVTQLDRAMGGALRGAIRNREFEGKTGRMLSVNVPPGAKLKAREVLLVGLGDGKLGPARLRALAARAARHASERKSLALLAPSQTPDAIEALAEGVVTGAYRYVRYLTRDRRPKRQLAQASLVCSKRPSTAARDAVNHGIAVGEGVNLARDLTNCPANDLTATNLGEIALKESRRVRIDCKVLNKKQIEKLGMPLLLAVNRGSTEEPRFIHMTYRPRGHSGRTPKVVFVGKGLTFDSGGLCIKPADGMLDMKTDMAGSAVTLGTVLAAARLKLPIEVHGVIGSTDNMTGGNAYRPGDVFPSRQGKTVEIINTDAEGRLVLADALAYASELKPDYIIDHATLTGACMVALGNHRAGLFSDDDDLCKRYAKAAELTGEAYWRLPLDEQLREQLRSSIADIKHTGTRYGGAITAALFLREFVGKTRWAHVDIAGPSRLDKSRGIHARGGTGFGVRTAVEFLKGL